jgi:hypothetical protein
MKLCFAVVYSSHTDFPHNGMMNIKIVKSSAAARIQSYFWADLCVSFIHGHMWEGPLHMVRPFITEW